MPSIFDKNLLPEFDSVKDNDEEILWSDKPKFIPYTTTGLISFISISIFVGVSWIIAKNIKTEDGNSTFNWFILLPVVILLWQFLRKLFAYNNTYYAYTNKRIMMRSGFIGTDFKSIDYDNISDIEVTVNFVERIFKVGTIKFYSGRVEVNDSVATKLYDRWEAIANPYEIFKEVKQISVDIKTDYNYPNALRPDVNPGYNTRYQRK